MLDAELRLLLQHLTHLGFVSAVGDRDGGKGPANEGMFARGGLSDEEGGELEVAAQLQALLDLLDDSILAGEILFHRHPV